ncbi:Cytochrome P450 monooxygenase FUM15 [Lachnellula arida]|uniref:Cytochrome P450 monooxygenase FUM15 n=1 Tax=Lachnellula arida TaxID=1316785 RepID=A0A8T9BSM6_9HELO|nr:Cytochrome P450 monooxygenase FUM15 [Lachnellula arida]
MSNVPVKAITAVSAVATYILVEHQPGLLLFSRPSYLGTFSQLFIVGFMLFAVWRVILWPKFVSPLRHLPGPSGGSWWNGQFPDILARPTGIPMIEWINSVPNEGLIRYLGLLNAERLIIASPKALGEVLVAKNYDFVKPAHVTAGLGRLLGVGVLLAEGDEHKFQRKNLAPAFSFRHTKDLYPVFWDKSREVVQKMTEKVNSGGDALQQDFKDPKDLAKSPVSDGTPVLEVGSWAGRATLDIIGVAGMGQDFGAIQDPDNLLSVTYQKIFRPTKAAAVLALVGLLLPTWLVRALPVKRNEDLNHASGVIRDTCRQLIRSKKEKLEKGELQDVDILSVALESGGFTDENLVDQLMTFLAAGHETTATAITWAVYMLCLFPEMQTRLRAEIRDHLPSINNDSTVTSQQIDRMPYLNAVCSELLRYYAPVPLTPRIAARDTTIIGQKVPKGTQVMLVPWAVNKAENLWGPDAGKFNPDRWLPSDKNPQSANGGAPSAYSLLTFLHGPRSCIGQSFAKAEFACLLAAWIGRFEFALFDENERDEKNIKIKGGVTARPANGMYVKTKVVDGW